jgi:hypothetical protein
MNTVTVDARKLELLKVWLSIFETIIDADDMNNPDKLEKLKGLRKLIAEEMKR